jgi:hypothetical protein
MRSMSVVFSALLALSSLRQAQTIGIHVPGDSSTIQSGALLCEPYRGIVTW